MVPLTSSGYWNRFEPIPKFPGIYIVGTLISKFFAAISVPIPMFPILEIWKKGVPSFLTITSPLTFKRRVPTVVSPNVTVPDCNA